MRTYYRITIYTRLRTTDLSEDITSASTEVPTGPFIAYYYPGYGNCAITDYNSTFTVNFATSTVYSLTAGIRYVMHLNVPSATGFISEATVTTITGTTTTVRSGLTSFQVTSPTSSRTIDNQTKYCSYKYVCRAAADNMTGLLFTPEVFLRSNIKYLHINSPQLFHGPLSRHNSQFTVEYTATGKSTTYTAYSNTYYYFTKGITLTGGY